MTLNQLEVELRRFVASCRQKFEIGNLAPFTSFNDQLNEILFTTPDSAHLTAEQAASSSCFFPRALLLWKDFNYGF